MKFKHDRANEVCTNLVSANDRIPEALCRYVIGSDDFRQVTGRSELAHRPRVKWGSDYIGRPVPLDCPAYPKESGFGSWKKWFQESSAPRLLELAEIVGQTPVEFFNTYKYS